VEERNRKLAYAAIVGALAMAVGAGAGLAGRPAGQVSPAPSPGTLGRVLEMIDVHVAGWVVSPGVVSVPDGSIVAVAIEAAGGMRAGAEAGSLNLAATLAAGEQVVVPGPGVGSDGGATTTGGLISLNRAGAAQLEELPGVGPVLAQRIVDFRETNGPFETVEDLLDVAGVGEAKLAAIRDLVTP